MKRVFEEKNIKITQLEGEISNLKNQISDSRHLLEVERESVRLTEIDIQDIKSRYNAIQSLMPKFERANKKKDELKKELIAKLEEIAKYEQTISKLTHESSDVKNKVVIVTKERDGLIEERSKLIASYKDELSKLHTSISAKAKEEDKSFKTLHSEKLDLQSKFDTTSFKLSECESELRSSRATSEEYKVKFERLSKEHAELVEKKRQIQQEFDLNDKLLKFSK
jgi:chromosome segregation ATPase